MKSHKEIRLDLGGIMESDPPDLIDKLTDYIVRMRHDDLVADDELCSRLNGHKPLYRCNERKLPISQINPGAVATGDVSRPKSGGTVPVEIPKQSVSD